MTSKSEDDLDIERQRLGLEKERAAHDIEFRRQELELRRQGQAVRPFGSPLFLSVVAAFMGLIGNTLLANMNAASNREAESTRAEHQLILQRSQAEAALILKAIDTGNPETAATNLKFLADTKLVSQSLALNEYLKVRKPLEGPYLPGHSPIPGGSMLHVEYSSKSKLELWVRDTGHFDPVTVFLGGILQEQVVDHSTGKYPIESSGTEVAILVRFVGQDGGLSVIVDVTKPESPVEIAKQSGHAHSYILVQTP